MDISDLDFNISASSIIASLLFSTIGIWLYRRGRKENNLPWMIISAVLMLYSYFTRGPIQDWGLGLMLCGAAYFCRDMN